MVGTVLGSALGTALQLRRRAAERATASCRPFPTLGGVADDTIRGARVTFLAGVVVSFVVLLLCSLAAAASAAAVIGVLGAVSGCEGERARGED